MKVILSIILVASAANVFSQNVVISEIYGGGGNSGSIYKNDFVELYNPTNSSVDLTGWSVQYISATGTGTWQKTSLSGSISPRSYFLVQEAAGSGGTTSLPTPDITGSIVLAATAGKVALVSNTTALSSTNMAGVVDLVGFGSNANLFEGSAPAPAPSNTNSIERKANALSTSASMQNGGGDQYSGNGFDSDSNNTDFVTRLPEPQNSASLVEPDIIPPSFSSSYPTQSNISSTSFDLIINLTENGKVYYVVLPNNATMPSSAQVKAGQDGQGNGVSISGSISATSNGVDFSKTISGLSPSTTFDVYVVGEDAALNLQPNATLINVTTNAAPSIDPLISSYTFSTFIDKAKQAVASYVLTASNLEGDVNLNVSGNYLISSDNSAFTTSLTILAASFISPQTVYVKLNPAGTVGVLTGTITHSSTGALDAIVSLSGVAIDPFNQDFNDPAFLTNSGWMQFSVTGSQDWGSTNYGHTCLIGCNNATADKAAQMSGYSGGPKTNEAWLISPQLDLTTIVNYPALSFASITTYDGDQLQLKYSTDYAGSGDPTLATWTSINGKFPGANSSAWTNSSNIILPKTKLFVAFVYTSNATSASRWTIDDWKVEDVQTYLDIPPINFSFGEIVTGNLSQSQTFSVNANGYGDIMISVSPGFEISLDNSLFATNVVVTSPNASAGQNIYIRFAPSSKQLKWNSTINFIGTGLNYSSGVLSGSSYPKIETLNVATYNLEFFGTDVKSTSNFEFGPTDDALQIANVSKVLQTIGADIFAVQEISDDNALAQLVSNLPGYDKVVSDRWSYSWQAPDPNYPPQKTGFVFNTSRVNFVSARVMFASLYDEIIAGTQILPSYPTGISSSFWSSGRLPFMTTFDVTIDGVKRRIHLIDIHSKSASDQQSYDRRVYDVKVLHDSLNTYYPYDNIILLGDFNDQVYGSIFSGAQSPYNVFTDDANNFQAVTYDLNVAGASTYPNSNSFIDNVVVSNELTNAYVANSATVEDPRSYVSNYLNTTSDHLPVSARFLLSSKADQVITFDPLPAKTYSDSVFTLSAKASSGLDISFTSSDPTIVSLNGDDATIHKTGIVTIAASQSGDADFNVAASVDQLVIISKADQVITFDELPVKVYGDDSFVLEASSSSDLDVTYTSSDPTIASVNGNVVTVLRAGSVTITASQQGDSNFNSAEDEDQPLTIKKANQTITFNTIAAKTLDDSPFTVSASSSSGLEVTFSSTSNKVTVAGAEVTLNKSGRAFVTAMQAGNENYNAASPLDQSFCIDPMKPSITIDNSDPTAIVLTSTGSSGNQWFLNGALITNATETTFDVTKSGVYKVRSHSDDCYSEFSNDAELVVTGIERALIPIIYPNPVGDYLFLSGVEGEVDSSLIDARGGILIRREEVIGGEHRMRVDDLAPGIYFLRVRVEENVRTLKFLKK